MTTWCPFTLAVVMNALPSDLGQLYTNWITAHPEKANRLAEIVAETRAAFRDAVSANLLNVMDAATDTLPNVGFRHALNVTIFNLGMEMGAQLSPEAYNQVTRADIWLRMVQNGAIPIPCDADLRGGTPSYSAPVERGCGMRRVLICGLVAVGLTGSALAGWLDPSQPGFTADETLLRIAGDRSNAVVLVGATNELWQSLDSHNHDGRYDVAGAAVNAASNAMRVIQIDTQAWVSVDGGTATLWKVGLTQDTAWVAATIVNNNNPAVLMTYRGNGYWWDGQTFQGGHSVYPDGSSWVFHTPNFGMQWIGGTYPILPADVVYGGNNHLTLQAYGSEQVLVNVGVPHLVTNAFPLAQFSDLPNLAPYATTGLLAVASNALAQTIAAITPGSIGALPVAGGVVGSLTVRTDDGMGGIYDVSLVPGDGCFRIVRGNNWADCYRFDWNGMQWGASESFVAGAVQQHDQAEGAHAGMFASAAQGAKADTAAQPNAVSGSDPVGTTVANGQVTTVGSARPWEHATTNEIGFGFYAVGSAGTSLVVRINEAQILTQIVARCDIGAATATVFSVAIWSNAWATATPLVDVLVSTTPTLTNLSASLQANGGWAIAFTNGSSAVTNGTIQLRTVNQ